MGRKNVRIGIVGAGFIGRIHYNAYKKVNEAQVTAVADKRKEYARQLADSTDIRVYSSLDEMLAGEQLDVLDVCLPTALHKKAVLAGCRVGLDIIVEKPFALNLDDIDEMIEGAEKCNCRLMVAHVCRFIPEYIFARSIIEEENLGRPLFFGAWRNSPTPDWSWKNWLLNPELSGGTIMDLQIHDIDLSNWLLGKPAGFYAQEVKKTGLTGPGHVISNIKYRETMATLEAGHLMPASYPFTTGYRLLLEQGVVEAARRDGKCRVELISKKGRERISLSKLSSESGDDPYAAELNHFIKALLTGSQFKISLDDARLAVETARKLMESLKKSLPD